MRQPACTRYRRLLGRVAPALFAADTAGIPDLALLMTSSEKTRARPREAKPTEQPANARELAAGHGEHPRTPLIVGIGASAGGLEAYRAFFGHMEANEDIAFVLVQHLAPDKSSLLAELIGRSTDMPVLEATDGTVVEGNHIYVIPPDATLTIQHGVLQLSKPAPPRQYRWPIDTFFTSLAEDQGDNAVAIVLSGSGSDGARGLHAVKDGGGLVLAQAGFDHVAMSGMPASAAATGFVDDVLPVEGMPARLLTHLAYLRATQSSKGPDGARQDLTGHLQAISSLIRAEVGHDFSQYKEKTLVRRIQRRMQVVQTDTVPGYIEYLKQNPTELENLFRELLISVTEFFRDPEAFEALQKQAIPMLLADKGAADILRVWVPACATGEEAYSIAIAFAEAIAQLRGGGPKVQIFATDIDDRAITAARSGRFRGPLPGVSPERLERWFIADGEYYVVVKPIREMIVFSPHSAIKDPPFSRLDLVSCRNLLIYLNSELQEHLIRTFHYSLHTGGILMLGPSESLGRNTALFSTLDKKHRLYVRRSDGRTTLPVAIPRRPVNAGAIVRQASPRTTSTEDAIDRSARKLLERHVPAYVVIDGNHDVLRFSGDTGRYLGPSSGTATLNLFGLLHKGLRAPARAAVQQALSKRSTVTQEGQMMAPGGERVSVSLIAEPIPDENSGNDRRTSSQLCLLMFKDLPATAATTLPNIAAKNDASGDARRVQELELELATTREQLHTAIDELETANEEMKSANEEYQSVNEELQSSNEELETSKEEMQSINEELQTVNVELHSKNEVLARLNSDLQNLLESTQIATLFLDSSLHVSGFTPAISDLFHLREGDHGRPITEITARIPYPELRQDVKQVLRTLAMVERVLQGGPDGAVYLLRMRPYRTTDNVIDGVVLTFIDITERQQHEYERGRLAAIVESSQDAIIGHSLEGAIHTWNKGAEQMFGYPAARVLGKSLGMLLPKDADAQLRDMLSSCAGTSPQNEMEMSWHRQDGTGVQVSVRCSPIFDPSGAIVGGSTIVRDITERQRVARRLEESERRLSAIIEQTSVGVAQTDLTGRFELVNPRLCEIVGRSADELRSLRMQDLVRPEDRAESEAKFQALAAGGAPFNTEKSYVRPDGSTVWVSKYVSLIYDDDGRPSKAVAVILDITRRKLEAEHRELLLHELNHRVKNSLATVQAIAMRTFASATDLASFRDAFMSRLLALSGTHDLLARESWRGVELRNLVDAELTPYTEAGRQSPDIAGEPVHLNPRTAVALSLALHELATNASKYGALSTADGRVDVRWAVFTRDDQPWLELMWSESGGPPVGPPARRGFGSRLIAEGIKHELGGDVSLDFPVTGIVCRIAIPLVDPDADDD